MGFLINSIFFNVRLNWKRRKASCGARKQHCRRWKFYKLWFSYRENKTIFGCHGCQHGCARAFRLTCSRCYVHFTIKMWLKNERRMSLWRHNQLESNRQREINFNCGWSHRVLQSWLVLQSSQPITSRLNWQTTNNVTRSSANQDNWPETCNIILLTIHSSLDSGDDFRSGCRNVSQLSPETVLLRTTLTRTIIIYGPKIKFYLCTIVVVVFCLFCFVLFCFVLSFFFFCVPVNYCTFLSFWKLVFSTLTDSWVKLSIKIACRMIKLIEGWTHRSNPFCAMLFTKPLAFVRPPAHPRWDLFSTGLGLNVVKIRFVCWYFNKDRRILWLSLYFFNISFVVVHKL